jgi:lysophospholipase L1-like esterase
MNRLCFVLIAEAEKLVDLVSVQKRGPLFKGKARGRRKSAYTWYVSIFRRLSNAVIGQEDRFRMGTNLTILLSILFLGGCGGEGGASDTDLINENSAPVANAGPDQQVTTGSLVTLDGSGSTDADGDLLAYSWIFLAKPAGSSAALSDLTGARSTFTADLAGNYLLSLVVDDGRVQSQADTVTITAAAQNSAPVANAGQNQHTATGSLVTLDGSGSTDADGDLLAYSWILLAKPAGSAAALSDPTAARPTFIADLEGNYLLRLIVDDGRVQSQADTVTITAAAQNSAPVANAGQNQHTATGSLVTLDGSGSSDADGDVLAYSWTFLAKPAGSSAALSDPTAARPSFTADLEGNYLLRLVVDDGRVQSQADTVTVSSYSVENRAEDIIIDNGSAGTTAKGVWTPSGAPYPYGPNSLYSKEVNASYSFERPAAGVHDLYLWWTQESERGNAVQIEVYDTEVRLDTVFVNQRLDGGRWNWLGTYDFSGTARIVIISLDAQSTTCADAVRLVPITGVGPSVTLTFPASYHLQTSPDLIVSADARHLEKGWGVRFLLDAGAQVSDDYSPPYEAKFSGVSRAEHTIDARVIDDQGRVVAGPDAYSRVIQIGIGDYFVAMGDSITWGIGDNISSDDFSFDGRDRSIGYSPVLNDLLTGTRKFPHHFANEGVGSAGSAEGKAIVRTLVGKHPDAQIFLVQYGTNDSASWSKVPSGLGLWPGDSGYNKSYKDNMQQIINVIRGAGKEVYLAKIPITLGETSGGSRFATPETALRNQFVREYNEVVEELTLANHLAVSPPDFYAYFAGVNPVTGKYIYQEEFADNLHPNGLGYRAMARLWKEALFSDR